MPNVTVTGQFVAMEAVNMLGYEIAGLHPMVMKRGAPTSALYIDFACPFDAPDVDVVVSALRPAVQQLAKAIKRRHIKRFYRGELPIGVEMAYQVVSRDIALTFVRFFDLQKRAMVNRLELLGAVRH